MAKTSQKLIEIDDVDDTKNTTVETSMLNVIEYRRETRDFSKNNTPLEPLRHV